MSEQTYRKKSRLFNLNPQQQQQHYNKVPLSSVALNLCDVELSKTTSTCGVAAAAASAANIATNDQDIGNNNFQESIARQRLTEEHLKTNVQIVLTNINRNYNALQGVAALHANKHNNQQQLLDSLNCKLIDKMTSPEADYNSNPHYALNQLQCSVASSQDFTHDNSDYQWFLDYGYREGVPHQSILSSLSASYNGIGELSYYEDLAKNIDVNLAEVDMESFRAEDINSLLNIPSSRKRPENEFDASICKSELLFSPVKESHISVDSLDMDGYPNEDIILTCKANKDNYTIAFEGSIAYSEDSYYGETRGGGGGRHQRIDEVVRRKALESMSRSDTGFTTWSKLKKAASSQLQRYPSGNNNTSVTQVPRHNPHCILRKSSSMPSLHHPGGKGNVLNVSQAVSSFATNGRFPRVVMPSSGTESPAPLQSSSNTSNNEHVPNQPSFSLVKLFIKQKSNSTDTCMDVSSGCWPSDSSSSAEQNRVRKRSMNDSGKCSALSRHDEEGDDDSSSCQYDSLDVQVNMDNKAAATRQRSNDLYKEVFDSPSRRSYKECNLNIRTQPKHPAVFNLNNNNSLEANKSLTDTSRTSENLTQVYNKMRVPLDMITRSMQTSFPIAPPKERVKVVPPSFLAQLNRHEKKTAPVYVIYPNYTLPNLDFLEMQNEVILSPLEFPATKRPRPKSLADIENIAAGKYNHIVDWKSLFMLLPKEYRRMLRNLPEVEDDVDDYDVDVTSQKPIFSMTPPIRRSSRPLSCDCASYVQGTCTSSSSNSSTNQPPSSGYRGSSTLLTDSELDNNNDNMRNMYVYQYDNNKIESDVERPPTGRNVKGILRRGASQPKPRYKRNSMIEEEQRAQVEKRRSLQDIPYYEDFPEEYESVDKRLPYRSRPLYSGYNNIDPSNHRLPHPKQYYDCNAVKLNKTNYNYMTELNDLELNRALSGRLSQTPPFTSPQKDPDADARIRAENFLSSVPKSELKYYAEVANILESIENVTEPYDRLKLRNEVSRALVQKRVSFNPPEGTNNPNIINNNLLVMPAAGLKPFTTPPNSPNISMAVPKAKAAASEKEKQEKIQSNRFKRLQIQWELLSKESQGTLKENKLETKSGGSTPTSAPKSRIPRPVSYPTAKPLHTDNKSLRSPSKIVPPRKYTTTANTSSPTIPPAVTTRTTTKLHGTPKRTPTPRVATRTR
ncbi:uncharacterized protein LOC129786646 isoform X2 [Lutzomyia longipalpis]|nr:uncharacterized protein LOC129786646 isoform X2 [Lutzomyia longipalpis]XP_055677761.1 uncharacterized protein LOC129786646 isoform X2 [Lutzomyia longipalpis]